MASSANGGVGEEEAKELADQLSKTLKEGERILAPTRRPDGTLRKPIRIRAGYVPQDEVAIYQSKGALMRKEMASLEVVPPGYDPVLDGKPKTKSAKRNERKKEKRLQEFCMLACIAWGSVCAKKDILEGKLSWGAALDKGKDWKSEASSAEDVNESKELVESVVSQMNELGISANSSAATPPSNSTESSAPGDHVPDIDKRIRALKKKIRLTEAQQQKCDLKPEQLEKLAKLEDWRKELKLLEDKKTELASS
ncbi:hypothetical protein LguiB_006803 [Lonicera macranthoides]